MHPPFNSLSQPNAYGNMKSSVPSKKVDVLLFKFVKCDRTTFDAPASLAVDDFFFHVTWAEVAERQSGLADLLTFYPSRAKSSQMNLIPSNNILWGIFLLYYPKSQFNYPWYTSSTLSTLSRSFISGLGVAAAAAYNKGRR